MAGHPLGEDQRPHDAPQGVAAVEDAQVLATGDPRRGSNSTASSHLVRNVSGPPGPAGTARAEVEPAGDRQEPPRLSRLVEQPRGRPVVGSDGTARLGQRAVYSWKVQVPQTWGLERWTLVCTAEAM